MRSSSATDRLELGEVDWAGSIHRAYREEHEHARACDAAEGLVDLPPPAVGLVDIEEEREPIDAPVVVAHELAVFVRRVVPQLLAQPDQDHGEERGHPDRPYKDRDKRELFEEGVPDGSEYDMRVL